MSGEAREFTRLEVYEGPNQHGEYHFALFWMADYHPGHPDGEHRHAERGQHFLAPLPEFPIEKTVDLRGGRR